MILLRMLALLPWLFWWQAIVPDAGVRVEPSTVDFGQLEPGAARTATFRLHNDSTRAVRVQSAFPSCKCTDITDLAGVEIPAGGQVELQATLQAPRAPGPKDAKVFVTLEGASRPLVAQMQGEVVWAVQPSPPYVDALKGARTGTVTLRSTDQAPFRVRSVDGRPPVGAAASDPAVPALEHVMTWNLHGVPDGSFRQWMLVETDHPGARLIPLRVRHESTGVRFDPGATKRGWQVPESVVVLGAVKVGDAATCRVILENAVPRGKPRPAGWDRITGVRSEDPRLQAELLQATAKGDAVEVTMRVTVQPGSPGVLWMPVAIEGATGMGRCFVAAVVDP